MSTISVPLSPELEEKLDNLVAERGSNRAEIMRYALKRLAEEEAVEAVLRAERELTEGKGLKGDLKELARQLPD